MKLENYIQASGPLFEAVQKGILFPDGKTFVDSYPKSDPQEVLQTYLKEKDQKSFSLKAFVDHHFVFPEEEKRKPLQASCMTDYIYAMWEVLEKEMVAPSPYSTLISLPKPHIVPGGRFRECFYWDSYFTAIGLAVSGQVESIKNMIENFAFLIDALGYIPNGNRVYFASRSQPPYFSYLLHLMLEYEEEWVLSFMPQLEAEYTYWMKECAVTLEDGNVLNRYTDALDLPRPEAFHRETALAQEGHGPEFFRNLRAACASGWDFSSRWLKDPKHFQSIWALDLLPIDLNCLMHHLEETLSDFAKRLGDHSKERHYQEQADKRATLIQSLFWNEEKQFFFDYHVNAKMHTDTWSLAAATPLFRSLATQSQAEAVSRHLEEKFLKDGGFATSLYEGIHQWDMPNGWAPLEWIAIRGLLHYGQDGLAKEAATRWLHLNEKIYKQKGKLLEKYNVRDCSADVARGEYELQEGFGWTNGVALALIDLFQMQ